MSDALLQVRNIESYYGPIMALRGVAMDVKPAQIVAVLGANGAGKSTLLRTISGVMDPKVGTVTFDGQEIAGRDPDKVVRLGMSLVPEGRQVFPFLTVAENLDMGAFGRRDRSAVPEDLDTVYGYFPRLAERREQAAGMLSGGEQQMLAMARILRTGARLLLLDEITEGLAPVIVQKLGEVLVQLKERGMTIVLVEQNFRFAAPLADRHFVMDHGQIVEEITAEQLPSRREHLNSMLGV